jgi:hypothetical protein
MFPEMNVASADSCRGYVDEAFTCRRRWGGDFDDGELVGWVCCYGDVGGFESSGCCGHRSQASVRKFPMVFAWSFQQGGCIGNTISQFQHRELSSYIDKSQLLAQHHKKSSNTVTAQATHQYSTPHNTSTSYHSTQQ